MPPEVLAEVEPLPATAAEPAVHREPVVAASLNARAEDHPFARQFAAEWLALFVGLAVLAAPVRRRRGPVEVPTPVPAS